jgi:predicted ATPase/DNA-binding winged helix-turn-helix (wHTH) protein
MNTRSDANDMRAAGSALHVVFGEFCLDLDVQRLSRHGQPVELDPRSWGVLCYLVSRAGQLVTKAEILTAAWPDVVVSDAALSQAVQRLRRALNDDARQARYIETVHRRGFRVVAAIGCEHGGQTAVQRGPLAPTAASPLFVGREAERRQLAEQLASACRESRRIVFIEGEAGMGKTALLNAFLRDHDGDALRVATALCREQRGKPEPYMPVLEALDRLARADRLVIELLSQHAPTWLAQMPWLIDPQERPRLGDTLTDATRGRMLREMARAVEIAASEIPVVLVIEDVHWADLATLDLLAALLQRTEPARLMVLATYRPAQAIVNGHPVIALARALGAKRMCVRLSLESLSAAEVREYLSSRFAAPDLAVSLSAPLQARSEGNPLFLETIVDHLVARGVVAEDSSGWHLTRGLGAADLEDIPENLREMVELQLDSVGPDEREVLEAASVAAVRFRAASVAAALGRPAADGVEAVEQVCERLVRRRHLLRAAGEQTWPDGTRTACYEFRHELYRQVLYERLPASHRRRLHQCIGERIECAYGVRAAAAEAVTLAEHFEEGRDRQRAIQYRRYAGEHALRRRAYPEAAFHLRRALQLLVPTVPLVEDKALRRPQLANLGRERLVDVKRLYARLCRLDRKNRVLTSPNPKKNGPVDSS